MADTNNYAYIPSVADQYDGFIEGNNDNYSPFRNADNTPAKKIVLSQNIGDKIICVVEAVALSEKKGNKLRILSTYIEDLSGDNKKAPEQEPHESSDSVGGTSETSAATNGAFINSNVSQNSSVVNNKFLLMSKTNNTGRTLSQGQREFFKNSVERCTILGGSFRKYPITSINLLLSPV